MQNSPTIEDHLAAVEAAVAELRDHLLVQPLPQTGSNKSSVRSRTSPPSKRCWSTAGPSRKREMSVEDVDP